MLNKGDANDTMKGDTANEADTRELYAYSTHGRQELQVVVIMNLSTLSRLSFVCSIWLLDDRDQMPVTH